MAHARTTDDTIGEAGEHELFSARVTEQHTHDGPRAQAAVRLVTTVQLELCGVHMDLRTRDDVLSRAERHLRGRCRAPLALGSVNLDHIHHFGVRRGRAIAAPRLGGGPDWLMLIDGAPVARRASLAVGQLWPRIAGADLLPGLLDVAERTGSRVGFLGGFPQTVPRLRERLETGWPDLGPATFWTPPRSVIDSVAESRLLARAVADAGIDLLVVGLGKPRQEQWIEAHGLDTGAQVLAAFGAAADFLAGSARRAPEWMRTAGLEWAFRLAQEPQRLARRYLVEGPGALWAMHRAPASITHVQRRALTDGGPSRPAPAP